MTGQVSKLGRRREKAIAALLGSYTHEQAARAAGIGTTTLARYKKEPSFVAAWDAALRAEYAQSMARLQQGIFQAAATLLKNAVSSSGKSASRLNAALDILRKAEDVVAMQDFEAELAEVERALSASGTEPGTGAAAGRKTRSAGHGAKFPGRKGKAILGLLTKRSIAEAADFAGVAPRTIYNWMEGVEFLAGLAAAAEEAFGTAARLLLQSVSPAVTVVRSYMSDPAVPKPTQDKAAGYVFSRNWAQWVEFREGRIAGMEAAAVNGGKTEPGGSAARIGRRLYKRLQRLKESLLPPDWPRDSEMVYVHAVDGEAVGSSVIGPDGGHVWLQAPEGCQEGAPC
jgi:hypothetical protein